MACSCQQQQQGALQLLPLELAAANNENLHFFIQGVRTGLQIKAAEQVKWQRMGVMLAITFGAIAFWKHVKD